MEIQWVDPSPEAIIRAESKGGKYIDFAVALRAHQGRWAVLPDSDTAPRDLKQSQTLSQNVRNGKVAGFKKGEYEVILDDATGKPLIHVRFTGAKDDEPEPPQPAKKATPRPPAKDKDEPAAPPTPPADPLEDPQGDPTDEWVDPVEVRKWAVRAGHQVSDRGRISRDIIQAYLDDRRTQRAHEELGEERPVPLSSVS